MDPKKLEELIWQARARVTWGDSAEQVSKFLSDEGVEPRRIDEIVHASMNERDTEIRKKGVSEIFIGSAILAVAAFMLLGMLAGGFVNSRVFVVCVGGGGYGLIRLIRGIVWLVQGKNVHGSIGDLDQA